MGNTHVVSIWIPSGLQYGSKECYRGESLTAAIAALLRARIRGHRYVKFEWRST